jgi:hypothetical protein
LNDQLLEHHQTLQFPYQNIAKEQHT